MYKNFTRFFCTPRGYIPKFLLIMKLTTFLLIVSLLQVSAASLAQKITLNEKNASLEDVFKEIKKQTGYDFVYTGKLIAKANPVTVQLDQATVDEALRACFVNQPLDYTIDEKTIIVKEKQIINPLRPAAPAPPKDITGRVTNKAGEPLSAATVLKKRTKSGSITDGNGRFNLRDVLPTDTLIVSYIGYKQLFVNVGDKTVFNLVMQEATNDLDQVVIEAYGKTSQRLNTGDISTVTAATIEKQPVMNPLLALQGNVPGLDVSQTNGYASAPVSVELRGRASLGEFASDPLYVIDGVPLSVNEAAGQSSYPTSVGFIQNGMTGPAGGQSPLFSINPDDIESITVLKDAAATAIYGSRGAQGVILITTKKGIAGKTKFEAKVEDGISEVTRFYQLLNTQQYIDVREETLRNDGITPNVSNAPDLVLWNTNSYTDWQKALYGRVGNATNVQMSLSGGDSRTTFRISAGYNNQDGITTVSGGDKKESVSFNLTHKSLNQLFSVSLTSIYSYTSSNMVSEAGSILLAPDAPPIYNAQGNLNYAGWAPLDYDYPFASLKQPYDAETYFLNDNLNIGFQPIKGLNISSNFGINYAEADQHEYRPIASLDPTSDPTGAAQFGYNNNKNWIVQPQISYDATIGKGKISALIGASAQTTNTDGIYVVGEGYTSDALIRTISNAPNQSTSDNYLEYKYASLFGRLNFNWQDEYLIDLTARRDGSSKFGPNNQFGNFAAVGAAWIFTQENWFKKNLPFLSYGKLRASYGSTGSDLVNAYAYLTRWTSNGLPSYDGIQPLNPTQHANPNYQWQVNKKLETAIELGFLQDRINLVADYYQNRTGNQLVEYSLPNLTGFSYVEANLPAVVQNQGLEFQLKAKIVSTPQFSWSVNGNISFNRNKLLAFPGLAQSPYAAEYAIGQPLNIVKVLHYLGIDPLTGQYIFQDKNNDGTISMNPGPTDDRYNVDLDPKYFGGFGTEFAYKGLSLSLFFTYKDQVGPNLLEQGSSPGTLNVNQPVQILGNEWQYPGDIATVAKFTTNPYQAYSYLINSDAGYTNASYVRLRNLSLSYNLPVPFIKKLGMTGCTVYIHADNLFVITPYKGIDPETMNFGGLPPAKIFIGGIKFNF